MDVVIDCSFDPSLWPISRELYPAFFRKLGGKSPFQNTLEFASMISDSIHVFIDKRISFMAERQANEIRIGLDFEPTFPALVLKPILKEVPDKALAEKIRSLKLPSAVLNRAGVIIGHIGESLEPPDEGGFLRIDAEVISIDDFEEVLREKGSFDNGYFTVVSDIEDARVIVTDDVVLITRKEDMSEIFRKYAEGEKKKVHRTAYRPWGSYTVLEDAPTHKVKRITVLPGKRLSLQLHRRRSERWTVIKGVARVTLGNEVFDLKVGESVFIPVETPHRLENPTDDVVEVIEVQIGDYFGEDDIIRLQDDFGRGNEV